MAGGGEKEKGRRNLKLNPPLVSLAGLAGAGVAEVALAEDKLMVLESYTASHTGAGIGSTIRGTHWDEAIWTAAGKTWGRQERDDNVFIPSFVMI